MNKSELDRREFIKGTSALVAAAAAQGMGAAAEPAVDPKKILNYNPKMGYRTLGKTGHMISEISLGGHGGHSAQDRVPVLEKAVEMGVNYVDNNIDAECNMYGEAMSLSSGAKREKWFIGFASWPEKITEDYEDKLTPDGMMKNIEARLKCYKTDMLDMWRPVGATWGQGQNNINTLLMVSKKALDMVVEVYEKAKQQGKVRFLGVSAHNPKVFRRVLEEYPQFNVVIFPYLFLTKEMGGDSLLKLAEEKQVGVIGLKPFGAGTVFGIKPRQVNGKVDPAAPALLREMLQEKRISALIPGVNTAEQIEMNVQASFDRDKPKSSQHNRLLNDARRNFYTHLTPEYHWLKQWEVV